MPPSAAFLRASTSARQSLTRLSFPDEANTICRASACADGRCARTFVVEMHAAWASGMVTVEMASLAVPPSVWVKLVRTRDSVRALSSPPAMTSDAVVEISTSSTVLMLFEWTW